MSSVKNPPSWSCFCHIFTVCTILFFCDPTILIIRYIAENLKFVSVVINVHVCNLGLKPPITSHAPSKFKKKKKTDNKHVGYIIYLLSAANIILLTLKVTYIYMVAELIRDSTFVMSFRHLEEGNQTHISGT